jgi:hypothetical protein
MFSGRFTATFLGQPTRNSKQSFGTKGTSFEIIGLDNIICLQANHLVSETDFNNIITENKSFKIQRKINQSQVSFHLPSRIENHNVDWENFYFHNLSFKEIHTANRGYFIKTFKNFTLFDSIAGFAIYILCFIPNLFNANWGNINPEIFVGYLEADFVCRVLPNQVNRPN